MVVVYVCDEFRFALGNSVVIQARRMLGETNPQESAPGTIRGDFSIAVGRNVIHGSDSVDTARREVALWFKEHELVEWTAPDHAWVYE